MFVSSPRISAKKRDPPASSSRRAAAAPAASTEGTKGTEEGAQALLKQFVSPDADHAALTRSLRPTAGDYRAMFDAATAPKVEVLKKLAGTSWRLVELEDSPVGEPPAGWPPQTLEFGREGLRLSGVAGVNVFGASYEEYGSELEIGRLALTRRLGPAELMEAERRYTHVLSRVVSWRQDGERLILVTIGEKRAAVFEPIKRPS